MLLLIYIPNKNIYNMLTKVFILLILITHIEAGFILFAGCQILCTLMYGSCLKGAPTKELQDNCHGAFVACTGLCSTALCSNPV